MHKYDPCMGCEYYNKPYWSVVSPCKSCPRVYGAGNHVTATTTTTTNIKIEKHDNFTIETTPEDFVKIVKDEMNIEEVADFLKKLGIQIKTEDGNYRLTYDVLKDISDAMSKT